MDRIMIGVAIFFLWLTVVLMIARCCTVSNRHPTEGGKDD